MKTLLRRMIFTQDDAVFNALIERGWPRTLYTSEDFIQDLRRLESILARGGTLNEWGLASPHKMFQQYNIEFAKILVMRDVRLSMIKVFTHNFLSRELTNEEIDEVLKEAYRTDQAEVRTSIDYMHREFKSHRLDLDIRRAVEQIKSEERNKGSV